MDNALRGKVAVVTGGGTGIGLAIGQALAAAGARVCLIGRRADVLRQAVATLGANATSFVADVGDESAVRALAGRVTDESGGVDLLVHNAAAYVAAPFASAAMADFDEQWRVNVRGPFLLTQLLLPGLVQRRGQVVFVNSSAGVRSHANVSQYAATKFALKAVADALREEVNVDGVRVISVYPGRTATPLQEQIMLKERRPYRPERLVQPADVAAVVLTTVTLPRTAQVFDVHVYPQQKP